MKAMNKSYRPVVLCVLDGWGHSAPSADNAISTASTPTWDRMLKEWPHTLIQASGKHVGLPDGQMGNSEVGHMNIGAGRIVMQDLPRINAAIKDGSLQQNPVLQQIKNSSGRCHILGLLSPGGVHSHQSHIRSLITILQDAGVEPVLHAFLDGRDTPPISAMDFISSFSDVQIGTIGGRYYGMDRDNRWDRIEKAYEAIVIGSGEHADSPMQAIETSYAKEVTDEFILPTVIGDYTGMQDGDSLLMANFRADRVRQILAALVDPNFSQFQRAKVVNFSAQVGMVEYSAALSELLTTVFPAIELSQSLGEIVADVGLKQLRIAETEKYAHVTFFFNGGREQAFMGEDRILVPSPKVATYDLQPEMSAAALTDKLLQALALKQYALVVVNYANTDMVGHTGDQVAAQKAVETVDKCLAQLEEAVLDQDGTLLITADHGNAEVMVNSATGNPHTAHTCNPVPLVMVSQLFKTTRLNEGKLADIAPTVLNILDIQCPAVMTGSSLFKNG